MVESPSPLRHRITGGERGSDIEYASIQPSVKFEKGWENDSPEDARTDASQRPVGWLAARARSTVSVSCSA
jgi:hypothetical protein